MTSLPRFSGEMDPSQWLVAIVTKVSPHYEYLSNSYYHVIPYLDMNINPAGGGSSLFEIAIDFITNWSRNS